MIPPNCLAPGRQHDGSATISFCEYCYVNLSEEELGRLLESARREIEFLETRERTPAEEAVLRAAVELVSGANGNAPLDGLVDAVDALLRENPAWDEEGQG